MINIYIKVVSYFNKTQDYSKLRFIIEMLVIAFILKFSFAIIFGFIFSLLGINVDTDLSYEQELAEKGLFYASILIILFATFETLVGQWLTINLAKMVTKRYLFILIFSATIFALLHVEPIIIAAVWPIGLILAWSFIIYRKKSLWSAIWVTTLIHVLHNLLVLWMVANSL